MIALFDLFLLKCSVLLLQTLLQLPLFPVLTLENYGKRTKAMLTYLFFFMSNAGEGGLQRGFEREEDNGLNWCRKSA